MMKKPFATVAIGLLISFSLVSFPFTAVQATTDISSILPDHRQWTIGERNDEVPLNIGPNSREWTCFCKTGPTSDSADSSLENTSEPTSDAKDSSLENISKDLSQLENTRTTEKTEEGVLVRFDSRVFFESASANITDQARQTLDQVVEIMKEHQNVKLTLQGHTNNLAVNTDEFANNKELSVARAEAARSYLMNNGIDEDLLSVQGFGEARPLMSNETARGLEMNRRVDFLFQPIK